MRGKGVVRPVVFVLVLLSSGLLASVPAATATTTAWSWAAPADAAGPGAFRVTIDFGAENNCEIQMTGVAQGSGPLLRMLFGDRGGAAASAGNLVQVHGDPVGIDTRSGSIGVGVRVTFVSAWAGAQDLSIYNANMDSVLAGQEDPWYAASFDVSCDAPFAVLGTAGSREAVSFDHTTMSGTGASANGLFAEAGANVNDRVTATLASPTTEAMVSDHTFTGAAYKEYRITPPDGPSSYGSSIDAASGSARSMSFEAGAGTWTIDLTQVGAANWLEFSGWIVGLEAVTDLDDVLA